MVSKSAANPRRVAAVKATEPSNAGSLDAARQVLAQHEADKNQREQGFLEELNALYAKYRVQLRTKPVELEVVALDEPAPEQQP